MAARKSTARCCLSLYYALKKVPHTNVQNSSPKLDLNVFSSGGDKYLAGKTDVLTVTSHVIPSSSSVFPAVSRVHHFG